MQDKLIKAFMAGKLQYEMSDVSPLMMEFKSPIFKVQINL